MNDFALCVKPILARYEDWLGKQPLSDNTRRTYAVQVRQYCKYLEQTPQDYGDPLSDPHAKNYAVRDYKSYLKTVLKRKQNTVNIALAAIDHFYSCLDVSPAQVPREELPQQAPQALNPDEQKRFLRAIERSPSARDRAVALLLFYTGLRISESVALDIDDVLISARKGKVVVREGKQDFYREVPLNPQVRTALAAWRQERKQQFASNENPAFFLNRQGVRLSVRATDLLLRKLGQEGNVTVSAHILRHTCLTNLVRSGVDLVLVAEIAGHRRLETTRRYTLPTEQDRMAAMERIQVDY